MFLKPIFTYKNLCFISLNRFLSILIFFISNQIFSQSTISGIIYDEKNLPIEFATIYIKGTAKATNTAKDGSFSLEIPSEKETEISIKYLGYKELNKKFKLDKNENTFWNTNLEQDVKSINTVDIEGKNIRREEAGMMVLDPRQTRMLPSAFGDFNKVLTALPGVSSNNELSSSYSVRGGNYDENLIYINGIEVYRPFLVSNGQQEGLSFVNPNLASSVEFSTGGWQAKYGDKLSSVMNVSYKKVSRNEASISLGLLGGAAHLGLVDNKNRISFVAGFRNKSGRYLLNTLPVEGQYFPNFNDLQTFTTIDLTNRKKDFPHSKRTELSVLASYAQNRYSLIPNIQETTFGTFDQQLLLKVDFVGNEKMNYDTWQGGAKFSHWASSNFRTEWYVSGMDTRERENINVESYYRLCDVNPDPAVNELNRCAVTRGVGTQFKYARNSLIANVIGVENRNYYKLNHFINLEFGAKYTRETFKDILNQYSFDDSLDFIIPNPKFSTFPALNTEINLNTNRYSGFLQASFRIDSTQKITFGSRIGWWDLNKEFLISPSVQYSYKPKWKRDVFIRASAGIYRQPPFYRELRDFNGNINPNLKAQTALHLLLGTDYMFKAWKRDFRLTTEIYYKNLWNVVPYDIDNVRLRYYAKNNAIAYATGIETRIAGEFIKGSESWFSLSIMQTEEKVEDQKWIRRPTDQRINVGFYIQDHVPGISAWKVYISLFFSTGLPVSIPNFPDKRSAFSAPPYRRLDVGTHYTLFYNDKTISKKFFESITIGVEVLNLFGINNTISYQWIADFDRKYYAIPNTLSNRFFNLKINATF